MVLNGFTCKVAWCIIPIQIYLHQSIHEWWSAFQRKVLCRNLWCYDGVFICVQTCPVFLQTYMPVYTVLCSWTCQSLSITQLSSMCLADIIGCFPLHLLQRAANGDPRLVRDDAGWVCDVLFHRYSKAVIYFRLTVYYLPVCVDSTEFRANEVCVYVSAHEVFSYTAVITGSVNLPWNANGLVIHVEWVVEHTGKWNWQWFAY